MLHGQPTYKLFDFVSIRNPRWLPSLDIVLAWGYVAEKEKKFSKRASWLNINCDIIIRWSLTNCFGIFVKIRNSRWTPQPILTKFGRNSPWVFPVLKYKWLLWITSKMTTIVENVKFWNSPIYPYFKLESA